MLKIKEVKYVDTLEGFNDVVIQVSWIYSVEGFQSLSGTLELPLPSSDTFIRIEDLDEKLIIGWVESLVNPASYQLQPEVVLPVVKTIIF